MFNSEAQARAYDRPPPTEYTPKYVSFNFFIIFIIFIKTLTEPKVYCADMNLEKTPKIIPLKRNLNPGPATYSVEKLKLD